MTNDEALALKKGDRVLTRISGKPVEVVVNAAWREAGRPDLVLVSVRRPGTQTNGRRTNSMRRRARHVLALIEKSRGNIECANVFADWLDEHGEIKAAAMLRAEFPLAGEKGG